MKWSEADYRFMARALQLARLGLYTTHPNPRVGCVLVRNDHILAEGWHVRAGKPHAEIHALQAAGTEARGADCYVTLEPCSHMGRTPPCTVALISGGVRRVIAATIDPNPQVAENGIGALHQAGIVTDTGLLQDEARALNPGFEMRMRYGRPYLRTKLAMSLDGRTALANGRSQWITGDNARWDVQRLRAQSSAIMTGIGTVLADDPRLTVRDVDTGGRQPLRIVIDPELKIPRGAQLLKEPGRTLVFTLSNNEEKKAAFTSSPVSIITLPATDRDSMIHPVLDYLARHEEVNEVLVEAGSVLNGVLLQAGLVDEVVIYMAPHILGQDARSLFHIPAIEEISKRVELKFEDIRMVGKDMRITLKPVKHEA
ncbi:MAG: bifunctional diaminohydroxyphosphoribosylaminopyrimidine deaminase/5-amino-6-(5-phosphoribosylamino)uracil reductase RibD [Gammaproteobacteria bacterium]